MQADESKTILLLGDAIPVYGQALSELIGSTGTGQTVIEAEEVRRHQRADSVAWEAAEMIVNGQMTDYLSVRPVYLRKAEAQRKLEEKLATEGQSEKR